MPINRISYRMNYFQLLSLLLIPGYVELFLIQFENCGNMGLYGVFLDIYVKRNCLYFSTGVLLVSYLSNLFYCGLAFYLFSAFLLLTTYNEWSPILLMNIQ
jgi:hypothetical protein